MLQRDAIRDLGLSTAQEIEIAQAWQTFVLFDSTLRLSRALCRVQAPLLELFRSRKRDALVDEARDKWSSVMKEMLASPAAGPESGLTDEVLRAMFDEMNVSVGKHTESEVP
jgi:hypothetical protein